MYESWASGTSGTTKPLTPLKFLLPALNGRGSLYVPHHTAQSYVLLFSSSPTNWPIHLVMLKMPNLAENASAWPFIFPLLSADCCSVISLKSSFGNICPNFSLFSTCIFFFFFTYFNFLQQSTFKKRMSLNAPLRNVSNFNNRDL